VRFFFTEVREDFRWWEVTGRAPFPPRLCSVPASPYPLRRDDLFQPLSFPGSSHSSPQTALHSPALSFPHAQCFLILSWPAIKSGSHTIVFRPPVLGQDAGVFSLLRLFVRGFFPSPWCTSPDNPQAPTRRFGPASRCAAGSVFLPLRRRCLFCQESAIRRRLFRSRLPADQVRFGPQPCPPSGFADLGSFSFPVGDPSREHGRLAFFPRHSAKHSLSSPQKLRVKLCALSCRHAPLLPPSFLSSLCCEILVPTESAPLPDALPTGGPRRGRSPSSARDRAAALPLLPYPVSAPSCS